MGKIYLQVEHNTSILTSIKTSKQNNRTKLISSRNMNCSLRGRRKKGTERGREKSTKEGKGKGEMSKRGFL